MLAVIGVGCTYTWSWLLDWRQAPLSAHQINIFTPVARLVTELVPEVELENTAPGGNACQKVVPELGCVADKTVLGDDAHNGATVPAETPPTASSI